MKRFLSNFKYVVLCAIISVATFSCSEDEDPVKPKSLKIDPSTLSIKVGETGQLTAIIEPEDVDDPTVKWSTSNETVATVENGIVTALDGGKCNIVATSINGLKATCKVTVVVDAKSLTIDGDATLEKEAGDLFELVATILPENTTDKTITWTSSNNDVATVTAGGTVTCVAEGQVSIKATTSNKIEAVVNINVAKGKFKMPTELVGNWNGVKFNLYDIAEDKVLSEDEIVALFVEGGDTEDAARAWIEEQRTTYRYVAESNAVINWYVTVDMGDGTTQVLPVPGVLSENENVENGYIGTYNLKEAGLVGDIEEQNYTYKNDQIEAFIDWNDSYKAYIYYEISKTTVQKTVKSNVIAPARLRKR